MLVVVVVVVVVACKQFSVQAGGGVATGGMLTSPAQIGRDTKSVKAMTANILCIGRYSLVSD